MEAHEFAVIRRRLGKTQKEMAELLATSLKTIHSYEQGWRTIPPHAQRQIYFLLSRAEAAGEKPRSCWEERHCPEEARSRCPAWEWGSGDLCWFVNGTFCEGAAHGSWEEKMQICRSCCVFKAFHEKRKND
ncbi:conserved hypothetical protein [uncultured Desulfatiglans sp.]|nr:conserved hypothetical protein [uncultured Desulfatiglans sp.]